MPAEHGDLQFAAPVSDTVNDLGPLLVVAALMVVEMAVLAFAPTWSCVLENIFPFTGFEIDMLELIENEGRLEVDFDELDRRLASADVLYLNTPHNPSGKVFCEEELRQIAGPDVGQHGPDGGDLPVRVLVRRIDDVDEEVGVAHLLQCRTECFDELVRKASDESDGVAHQRFVRA